MLNWFARHLISITILLTSSLAWSQNIDPPILTDTQGTSPQTTPSTEAVLPSWFKPIGEKNYELWIELSRFAIFYQVEEFKAAWSTLTEDQKLLFTNYKEQPSKDTLLHYAADVNLSKILKTQHEDVGREIIDTICPYAQAEQVYNELNSEQKTPIKYAMETGYKPIVMALLECGTDSTIQFRSSSLQMDIVTSGHVEAFSFIEEELDLEQYSSDGQNLLLRAIVMLKELSNYIPKETKELARYKERVAGLNTIIQKLQAKGLQPKTNKACDYFTSKAYTESSGDGVVIIKKEPGSYDKYVKNLPNKQETLANHSFDITLEELNEQAAATSIEHCQLLGYDTCEVLGNQWLPIAQSLNRYPIYNLSQSYNNVNIGNTIYHAVYHTLNSTVAVIGYKKGQSQKSCKYQ